MKNQNNKHYILTWLLTTLAVIAIIIFFLPHEKTFSYDFSLDKPWRYDQLTAAWEFPVVKTDEVLTRERDAAAAAVKPYYVIQPAIGDSLLKAFDTRYRNEFSALMPASLRATVTNRLKEVYEHGIIDTTLNTLHRDSVTRIKIIRGNMATETDLSHTFSPREAYEYVMQADTSAYGRHILRNCYLNDYTHANLLFDSLRTAEARQQARDAVMSGKKPVQAGQKIIGSGDIVDEEAYQTLLSYRKSWYEHNNSAGSELTLLGQAILVTLLVLSLVVFLARYRRDYTKRPAAILFLATQVILFPVAAALVAPTGKVMIIPFAMAPLMIRVFLDSRTAFMTHLIIILITSLIVPSPYEFVLLQLMAGLGAIFSLTELTERSQLFRSALVVLLTYIVVWGAMQLITISNIHQLDWHPCVTFVINAVLLLFTYPLLYLYEKLFRFTSNVTLVELSNINGKLLRTLSEEAPGTFQHSMQVANLAAAAANSIGANSQLVRTGALYHDIGKLENPVFFTENQNSTNPHACLPYEQSAQIIIDHVRSGLRMAEKNHLPDTIRQFIATHHGLSKTKYFYINWCNEHPGQTPDEELFTYPGPNPTTAETAILMMADSVEAASRSLPEYTEETISNLVDRIIDTQVADGAFTDCPLTFADIRTIKAVFIEKLRSVYHTRISYPELKK